MTDYQINLTDTDRIVLKETMNLILPPVDELPGAGDMGLASNAEELANRIPKYGLATRRVLDAIALDPSARAEGGFAALDQDQRNSALKTLEASIPETFDNFVDLIYIVYYSDERVHKRIEWRTGPLQPLGWELPPFNPRVLETTAKRKPFWRKA